MPNDEDNLPEVAVMTPEGFERARAALLRGAGVTMVELTEQASTGEFVSERARRAWSTIGPVGRAS